MPSPPIARPSALNPKTLNRTTISLTRSCAKESSTTPSLRTAKPPGSSLDDAQYQFNLGHVAAGATKAR